MISWTNISDVKDVDVISARLVCISNSHVPNPKVSETLSNAPIFLATSAVFNDGDVAWLACWLTLVVGLERIVLLIDDNVRGAISGEFTDLNLFYICEGIPVCIPALVARDPYVLALAEVTVAVIPKNTQGVGSFSCDSKIVVSVTVEITNGDIRRVTVGRIGSGY